MNTPLAFVVIFGICSAQQLNDLRRRPIAILSQSSDQSLDGSFNYGFQSENGIQAGASGRVLSLSPKEQVTVVQGSYSYTAPDGTPITTQYIADETGFHVQGAHIPREIQSLPGQPQLSQRQSFRQA